MNPTVKLEPKFRSRRLVDARGPMAAAALVSAGFPVLGVLVAPNGRVVYRFGADARPALNKFLTALTEMRALGDHAVKREPTRHAEYRS